MSVITRESINKNIIYHDYDSGQVYGFDELSREINAFKNILIKYVADIPTKKSIVIGIHPSIEQTACIFACFELGISICIIDYGRKDKFKQYSYIDPKTELLLPIDFFIVNTKFSTDKYDYFSRICNKTIILSEISKDYSENTKINATPDTILIRCTSSGTTDTPKIIEHKHEFMYHLALRNSNFYYGNVSVSQNLNHGSSIATYFIPALLSKNVVKICNAFIFTTGDKKNVDYFNDMDHILIPYTDKMDDFIKTKGQSNTILYTLSAIPKHYLKYYKQGKFKDVISIFGSNETSGPTLINQLSRPGFSSEKYYKVDNFFKLEFLNQELHVTLPYYKEITIGTNDKFMAVDEITYTFLGRSNLTKINGVAIDAPLYTKIVIESGLSKSSLIYDIFENRIYLAISDQENVQDVGNVVKKINDQLKKIIDKHYVVKFAVLDMTEFMSGVKLDHELIRNYFRKYIPTYKDII